MWLFPGEKKNPEAKDKRKSQSSSLISSTLTLRNESSDPFSTYSTTIITGRPANTQTRKHTFIISTKIIFLAIVNMRSSRKTQRK